MMTTAATTEQEAAPAEETADKGKYRVLFKLSEGGTANVFLAVARGQGGFNKLVVLKMPKEFVIEEVEARRMFMNEARLAARLNHANIVQTNEVVEHGGHPVIVMEYLDGQPLSSLLARARSTLPLAVHLTIISEALSGLHYAHEYADFDGQHLNIVHRDMTPHNVFVTFDGHVKLLDFGIAKLDRADGGTQTGVVKGKIRYMPAEQIMGDKLDRRADIFAVGVMLWEAAAGERMWKDDTEPVIMHRIVNGEIPSPRTVNPDVSAELERICMKALSADVSARYATAAELQADLDGVRGSLGQHTTSREIGRIVSNLFEDVRANTKKAIESQLSRVASLSVDEYQKTENDLVFSGAPRQFSQTGTTRTAGTERGTDSRTRLGVIALVLAAAVALIFVLRRPPKEEHPVQGITPTVTAPTAPPTVSATPASTTVSLRFSATPSEAKLFLDDAPLATNPYEGKLPKDGARHHVRAEASGYGTGTADIVLDHDEVVVLTLQKEHGSSESTKAWRPPVPHPTATATPTTAPTTPPKADCSPPYYIDERGIKKFKPECL